MQFPRIPGSIGLSGGASSAHREGRVDASDGQVIKTADWLIDLGPEGGAAGGEIVAARPLEDVVIKKAKRVDK